MTQYGDYYAVHGRAEQSVRYLYVRLCYHKRVPGHVVAVVPAVALAPPVVRTAVTIVVLVLRVR